MKHIIILASAALAFMSCIKDANFSRTNVYDPTVANPPRSLNLSSYPTSLPMCVKVTWISTATGVIGYNVYYTSNVANPGDLRAYVKLNTNGLVTMASFQDTNGFRSGLTNYYRVSSVYTNSTEGPMSTTYATVTVPTAGASAAQTAADAITLNFGGDGNSYDIYRFTVAPPGTKIVSDALGGPYVDSPLAGGGTIYQYLVFPKTADGFVGPPSGAGAAVFP